MSSVHIFPVVDPSGATTYRAIAESAQGEGATAGQALDAVRGRLPADESSTLVVVQSLQPDALFSAEQASRLSELMTSWRAARDAGAALDEKESAELQALVDCEFEAAKRRAANLLRDVGG